MEVKIRITVITSVVAIAVFLLPQVTSAQATSTEPSPSSAPQADDLIITEIMYNPQSVSDSKGEWFEIYNLSNKELDLKGCIFSDNDKDDFTINQSLIINPNDYLILGKNNNSTENGGAEVDFTYNGFTLANSEDEIIITCNEQEIDRVEYGKSRDFPDKAGYSIILADVNLNNNLGENWCLSSSSFGQGDKGTPGQENDSCQSAETKSPPPSIPVNSPPIAEAGPDQQGTVGQELQFDASQSYDPDGDQLTFYWDFGDGHTAQGRQVTHTYNKANVYLVVLTVDDGTETETDSLTVQITSTPNNTDSIIINELMPNPAGSDEYEWIELKNVSEQEINIEGFALSDATNKKYTLTSEKLGNLTIPAGGFFVIYKKQSRISLNNTSAESVKLYDNNQNIIDQVIYQPPVPENYSLSLIAGEWEWSQTPTPGTDNILTQQTNLSSDDTEEEDDNLSKQNQPSEAKTNSQTKSTAPDQTADCSQQLSDKIVINELWPSPQGNDRELEFIELKNLDNKDINLCNWKLTDKTRSFTFSSDFVIEALDFLVLPRSTTKISLNNNGDEISLISPDGKIINKVNYAAAKTNQSWSRKEDGSFAWTSKTTPWEENIFTSQTTNKESAPTNNQPKTKLAKPQTLFISLGDIKNYQPGSLITTRGIISVPPFVLGSQIMYVTDISQPTGLQIYKFDKQWPQLKEGDLVEVRGEISIVKNLPRLKITKTGYIKKINSNNQPITAAFSLDQIHLAPVHSLIKTQGEIIEKSKNKIIIAISENEATVYIKPSTGIKLSFLQEGDIIEVTGIVDKANDQIRILPRKQNDIQPTKVKGFTYQDQQQPLTSPLASRSKFSIWDYLNAFLAIIALTILIKIYKLKNN